MKKIMTARELFNYIQSFDKIIASVGEEANGFYTMMRASKVKLGKMNGIPCISGNILKTGVKKQELRNGGFSMSGDSFTCDIVEKSKNHHLLTVTSNKLSFPVRLELQKVELPPEE